MVKENNKENNNDSTYLYIIAIVAIVAIVAMVMMMSSPRGAPTSNTATLSDDDLAGEAIKKATIKPVVIEPQKCEENYGEIIFIDETHPCFSIVNELGITLIEDPSKACDGCSCSSGGATCSYPSRKCDCKKSFLGYAYDCRGHCETIEMRMGRE
jgi:hypothetical protein